MPRPLDRARRGRGEDEARVQPLEGAAAKLLDSLVAAASTLDATNRLFGTLAATGLAILGFESDELPAAPLDAIARDLAFMEPIAAPSRKAAEQLVAWAVGVTSEARLATAREALEDAIRAARDAIPIALPRPPRSRQKALERDALGCVAALIREAGLEGPDADVHLATRAGGRRVLVWAPVPPATAQVWLLESLYQRLEQAITGDELLLFERTASRWRFACWGGAERTRDPDDAFGRGVREQEYSLVERTTMALDAPVARALESQPWAGEVPPRERALAGALAESFAGVFTVRGRDGETAELEDAATGRRYAVHEHNPDIAYRAGFLALGRLIPFRDGRWLRSPGMAFFVPPDEGMAPRLAQGLTVSKDLPPAMGVEAIIATLGSPRRPVLPRKVSPAASREEAREILWELTTVLREAGLAKRVAKRKAPAELRDAGGPGTQVFEFSMEPDVAEWFSALSEMAGVGVPDDASKLPKRRRGPRKGKGS